MEKASFMPLGMTKNMAQFTNYH